MSIGPTVGIVVSAAGTSLAQTTGTDLVRSQEAASSQQRQLESVDKAELSAGIAATDSEDQQANDRDADGRRPWEYQHKAEAPSADVEAGNAAIGQPVRDPLGESGSQLDLTG